MSFIECEFKEGKTPAEYGTFTFINMNPSFLCGTARYLRTAAVASLLHLLMDGYVAKYHEVHARKLRVKVFNPPDSHATKDPLAQACLDVFGKVVKS